ncbi:DUF6495 family protein [Flavobacteriaceae bacterium]|jgi:hypothetical protein|nr:DUF6495 family protein [Flavobacteriaceae bacterium]MDB4643663.1 DUF6495 family protein [Flavobacteriaceae bacterium]
MEYKRLSTEQFEALHEEFATFLATNSIDKKEWDLLKLNEIEKAEVLLDLFSDMVWNDVLDKELFIEHLNPNHFFLFECLKDEINLILLKSEDHAIDFTSPSGLQWLQDNFQSESLSLFQSSKTYSNRKQEIFDLIQKGGNITTGTYFKSISSFLSNPS